MAVFTKTLRKHIFIHPGDQHKIHTAVRMVLMRDRKKFSDRMEGALLDVNNIKVIGDRHLIVHGHLSMEVKADFQIFAPAVGMTLKGRINKVHRKYCGCVTMDFFNVTLSYPNNYDVTPKEGDTCSFVVQSLIVNGDMLHLRGQLTSIDEDLAGGDINGAVNATDSSSTALEEGDMSELANQSCSMEATDNIIESRIGPSGDSLLGDSNKSSRKKHKKKLKEETLDFSINECDALNSENDLSGHSILDSEDANLKKKHKKNIKEETVNSSINECDIQHNIKSEIDISEDSLLMDGDKRSRKKHKKKSKEDSLLSSTDDLTGLNPVMKSEPEGDNDNIAENSRTLKKKHKKKSTETSLKLTMGNGDTSGTSRLEQEDESTTESDRSPKKKHKRKSKVDELESSQNDQDTTMSSDPNDSLSSETPKDKSKKKNKKRRRSEEHDESDRHPETDSVSPQRIKRLKES